jgi:hypothetical protein
MLDHEDKQKTDDWCRWHLNHKSIHILITNICNLACGGCHQHCGRIPKEKLFFIDLEELTWVIDWIIAHTQAKRIGIFGGEPSIHPKYEEILDLFRSYKEKAQFVIFTNNYLKQVEPQSGPQMFFPKGEDNIVYWVSPKDNPDFRFEPTLVAPIDIYGEQDKEFYWNLAKANCHQWNHCHCLIMHKRAYICETAGGMDNMTGENNGWELKWGEKSYDRSEEEIRAQASHFCHRCAWCLPADIKNNFTQRISDPTLVTISNINLVKKDVVVVATKTNL